MFKIIRYSILPRPYSWYQNLDWWFSN